MRRHHGAARPRGSPPPPPPTGSAHAQLLAAATDQPTSATRDADNDRTGWYPDETNLSPALVTGGTFGQLFNTNVNGAVYGQPLVDDGQLLVNTENNYSYGLDPVTGAILWSRQYGAPPLASAIGCADLAPTMGITGTPVVDQATETEYLVVDAVRLGRLGPAGGLHARPQSRRRRRRGARIPRRDRGHGPERPVGHVQPHLRAPAPRPAAA